jgi:RNA polymerase sigma factor (sigma-70 family)
MHSLYTPREENTAAEKRTALIAYHVAGARMGRKADFEAVFNLCDPKLRTHARRLCDDSETARDITQEAWIAIARALPTIRDDRAFLAFAMCIVTRAAARAIGRKKRRREADAGFVEAQPDSAPPAEGGDLYAAIAALPTPQRAALALFYTEGLSVAEVAVALDIPLGTVKTRLMNARARLRAHLTGDQDGQS